MTNNAQIRPILTNYDSKWIAFAVLLAFGCSDQSARLPQTKAVWRLENVRRSPAEVVITTGTTFKCGGVSCQLLGVKESNDPEVRKRALDFTKAWFESIGNYIGFYNSTSPLVDGNGNAIVWIRGMDMYISCLNVELVRAGLVDIDESQHKEYSFTTPSKDGDVIEDWQGLLLKAKQGNAKGEKLRVLFDWPPKM